MMKAGAANHHHRAWAIAAILLPLLTLVEAGSVTVTLIEVGNDVRVQVTGSIDFFATTFTSIMSDPPTLDLFTEGFLNADFTSNGNDDYKVSTIVNPVLNLAGCSGFPSVTSSGGATEVSKSSDSMPAIGFRAQTAGSVDTVQIYVADDYAPGAALSGSAILSGQSFTSLGLQVGVPCSVEWPSSTGGESITFLATDEEDDDDGCGVFGFVCNIFDFFVGIFDAVFGFFF